jgi:hypothetical protein
MRKHETPIPKWGLPEKVEFYVPSAEEVLGFDNPGLFVRFMEQARDAAQEWVLEQQRKKKPNLRLVQGRKKKSP